MTDDLPKIAAKGPAEVELVQGQAYFFCTCGLSNNQPFCDGSHKGTGLKSFRFEATETGTAWLCRCKRTKDQPFCDGTHKTL